MDDPNATFVKMLPDKSCPYALYNATLRDQEKEGGPGVIFKASDNTPFKSKMIYASPEDAMKKKLTGI